MPDKLKTQHTRGLLLSDADICRKFGWKAGTRLSAIGNDGWRYYIRITAIGMHEVLAYCEYGEMEEQMCLSDRNWRVEPKARKARRNA